MQTYLLIIGQMIWNEEERGIAICCSVLHQMGVILSGIVCGHCYVEWILIIWHGIHLVECQTSCWSCPTLHCLLPGFFKMSFITDCFLFCRNFWMFSFILHLLLLILLMPWSVNGLQEFEDSISIFISSDPLWYLLPDVTECRNSCASGYFDKNYVQQQDIWAPYAVLKVSLPGFALPVCEHILTCL